MTIHEMHILFDIEVQGGDNNIRKRVLPETKDLYLNMSIEELLAEYLRKLVEPEESKGYDTVEYYAFLSSLITQLTLYPVYFHSPTESKVRIPKHTSHEINSGNLMCGIEYLITCEGSTGDFNLTGKSYENYNESGVNIHLGDRFTLTANAYSTGTTPDITWGGVKVTPVKSYDYLRYVFSRSNTTVTCNLSNKAVVLNGGVPISGVEYVVTKNLGQANFKGWGASCNDIGTIFTASNVLTPTEAIVWTGGQLTPTAMVHYVENVLLKTKEYYRLAEHAFGTQISRPYCHIQGDNLIIRHDGKFTINSVNLDYIKKPTKVDFFKKIDSDMPVELHKDIVKRAVERYMAIDGNPIYQAIVGENMKSDKLGQTVKQ